MRPDCSASVAVVLPSTSHSLKQSIPINQDRHARYINRSLIVGLWAARREQVGDHDRLEDVQLKVPLRPEAQTHTGITGAALVTALAQHQHGKHAEMHSDME